MIVLLNDGNDKRAFNLREKLRERGLAALVTDSLHVRDFSAAFAAFTFADSESFLNTLSLRCGALPLLAVNESGSRIYNKDVMFYDPEHCESHEDFIVGYLRSRGISTDLYTSGDMKIHGTTVKYFAGTIELTPIEADIIRLAALCRGRFISEKLIEAACFSDRARSSRVSVHICNLNKKFRIATGRNALKCKRGLGYMLEIHL